MVSDLTFPSGSGDDQLVESPTDSPPVIPSELGQDSTTRSKQMPIVSGDNSNNTAYSSGSGEGEEHSGVCDGIIPSLHHARNLVLCFDGTGDQFDADNSNVVQFFSMLQKDNRQEQMVYYQAGIGTYTPPQIATPFVAKVSKTLDEMVAWNLSAHVMDGYEFLMQNYEAGDKICIFGFSRGAYTARALAGMVHKIGLLPACNHQQVPFAYKMFTRTDPRGWAQSTAFKKAFSMDVHIEFIGVWDTVSSVGLIPRTLPFTTSNTVVKTFRHAISMDEHRAKFQANYWNRPTREEEKLGTARGDMPKSERGMASKGVKKEQVGHGDGDKNQHHDRDAKMATTAKKHRLHQWELERRFSMLEHEEMETDVLEVWFSGCHCDVGGGSVPNHTRHNLARIPLRWMIRQCFLADTGIRFHAELLRTVGLDPASLYPVVLSRPPPVHLSPSVPHPLTETHPSNLGKPKLIGSNAPPTLPTSDTWGSIGYACHDSNGPKLSEEEEDLADALSPIYDQLELAKYWWALEVIPMRHRYQNEDDTWSTDISMNLGRGRRVPRDGKGNFFVHRSVKLRMDSKDLSGPYVPKAQFKFEPTWVD